MSVVNPLTLHSMSTSFLGQSDHEQQLHAKSLLEHELRQFVRGVGISDEDRKQHSSFIIGMVQIAQEVLGPSAKILVYGSAASGLCERYSDIDATIQIDFALLSERLLKIRRQPSFSETRGLCGLAVEALASYIETHPELDLSVRQLITGAKVPIVVFSTSSGQTIDISINNELPIHNTRLLRGYATLDERVRALVLSVKRWARIVGVSDAKVANLSSYSWTLLCIYYLQVRTPALVPSLQTNGIQSLPTCPIVCPCTGRSFDCRFAMPKERMVCSSNCTELLTGFFAFYSHEFVWGEEVVSIRTGNRRGREHYPQLPEGRLQQIAQPIHIEDPLDLQRNLNCVLDIDGLVRLRGAFAEVDKRIANASYPVLLTQARHLFYAKVQGMPGTASNAAGQDPQVSQSARRFSISSDTIVAAPVMPVADAPKVAGPSITASSSLTSPTTQSVTTPSVTTPVANLSQQIQRQVTSQSSKYFADLLSSVRECPPPRGFYLQKKVGPEESNEPFLIERW